MKLSSNDLSDDVLKSLGNSLSLLQYLHELDLSHNPGIGDLCDANDYSPFRYASFIEKLLLRGTGVTRICRDWRESLNMLSVLDLRDTKLASLSFDDLQFTRNVKAEVWLLGAPVMVQQIMSRQEFALAERAPASNTIVHIEAQLECDCRMYWTWRALSLPAFSIHGLHCVGHKQQNVSAEDMVCLRPEECEAAALPVACSCAERPDGNPNYDRRVVSVRCENASLTQMPRLHALSDSIERLYEMHLAHNKIAQLHADDLNNIEGLDLSYNSVTLIGPEPAARLANMDGVLDLTGNPLECDCRAVPLQLTLFARADDGRGLRGKPTCSNGSSLLDMKFTHCSPFTKLVVAWLVGSLSVLVSLALGVVACLASPSRRLFVRVVLQRWGCAWRVAEPPEDAARRYDAFVTFSHHDEAVMVELVARLEPPYRLCVHERDWVPGRYISDQVVESVRQSRRTVALVSCHFLESSWARAEFREAHAASMREARPRLVVVLLEEPSALHLDKQLRNYIRTNTYLRWGEPWFWEKLRVALPPPTPHVQPSTTHTSVNTSH